MTFTQKDYDVGTAAALGLIRQAVAEVMPQVPFPFRGMIPVDKEPDWAKHVTKVILDAVATAKE